MERDRQTKMLGGGAQSEINRCIECNNRADRLWDTKCTPCYSTAIYKSSRTPLSRMNKTSTDGGTPSSSSTQIIIKTHKTRAAAAAAAAATTPSTAAETTPTTTSRPPEPKRRKLCACSSSDQPQTPIRSSSAAAATKLVRLSPGDQHCLEVSNDFVAARESLFQIMPQNPRLQPLEIYPPSARNGMRLTFDLDFTNLALKLQRSTDPIEFYGKAGEYSWQMATLEKMGYNVGKLRHKFNILGKIAVKGKAVRDRNEAARERFGVLRAEASVVKRRIEELETELQQLEAKLKREKEEVEAMELAEKRLSEDRAETLNAIRSIAAAPWA